MFVNMLLQSSTSYDNQDWEKYLAAAGLTSTR